MKKKFIIVLLAFILLSSTKIPTYAGAQKDPYKYNNKFLLWNTKEHKPVILPEVESFAKDLSKTLKGNVKIFFVPDMDIRGEYFDHPFIQYSVKVESEKPEKYNYYTDLIFTRNRKLNQVNLSIWLNNKVTKKVAKQNETKIFDLIKHHFKEDVASAFKFKNPINRKNKKFLKELQNKRWLPVVDRQEHLISYNIQKMQAEEDFDNFNMKKYLNADILYDEYIKPEMTKYNLFNNFKNFKEYYKEVEFPEFTSEDTGIYDASDGAWLKLDTADTELRFRANADKNGNPAFYCKFDLNVINKKRISLIFENDIADKIYEFKDNDKDETDIKMKNGLILHVYRMDDPNKVKVYTKITDKNKNLRSNEGEFLEEIKYKHRKEN